MEAFIWLTIAFLLFMTGFCLLLARGLRTDTLEYDMQFLWENYSPQTRAKIRKTFN